MHGGYKLSDQREAYERRRRGRNRDYIVCERASESATYMYAYAYVHYLLQSADKIKRKASDRWTDADGPWTDSRREQRVVTDAGTRRRAGDTEGESEPAWRAYALQSSLALTAAWSD